MFVPVALALAFGTLPSAAFAGHNADAHKNMDLLFTSPNSRINSDLAFWGNHAFSGFYRNDQSVGGVRIFDISNPTAPQLLKTVNCDGLQADPIVWDRNGNGVADLLLLAVDRTMDAPECGAARSANHGNPTGWEGVRVFEMSDDPANPFATVEQVKAVYTDCGAHTITAWTGDAEGPDGRLVVYVSSYPLRAGPTCGDTEFANTANPFDGDPGSPANPQHGVIQVVEVPFADPAASSEIAQPPISYPGDPDGMIDWCERSVTGPGEPCPGPLEPGAVACHDIVVRMDDGLAGGACAEQGQVWRIDGNGIPDTANPITIVDDEVSSGGSGNIPGAIDFFHSVMFSNDGTVLNTIDESFGSGCPPQTQWRSRPWNPAGGTHKTGRMFFSDPSSGAFFSDFQVGNLRTDAGAGAYCSAHMGMTVPSVKRDLLVNAWYTGGVDVIDFTDPTRLREVAFYDIAGPGPMGSDNWSAYPYVGPRFRTGGGLPVYASDGVHTPDSARGLVVFRARVEQPRRTLDHLNPQTME